MFCDGSVHDEPEQRPKDEETRGELSARGYRVVVIRYDEDRNAQLLRNANIFGERG